MPVDLLVVGGTGLLGAELVRLATRSEGRAFAATFHETPPPGPEATTQGWVRLDLTDAAAIERAVVELEPRAVVNAAYAKGGPTLQPVTAEAPGVLATACAAHGVRFVHVSSDVVYSGTDEEPRREDHRPSPITDYGRAKLAADDAVLRADPTAAIARTSLLWGGPGLNVQERLVADPDVTFFTNEVRCPLRVDRLATALLELVDRPEIHGLLHVAGADAVDRLTFAQLLAPRVGVDPSELRGGVDESTDRPHHIVLDSSLARRTLRSPLPGIRADAPSGMHSH